MKIRVVWLLLIAIALNAGEIRIAVAANVSYAIEPLIKAFNNEYPDSKVNVILGSSGKLTAQISHGAPYDLFLSANMKYPEALYENGEAVTKPVVYAQGSLAFFSVKEQDFSKGMALLKELSIKRIAVANPKTAPYGVAAEEALKKAKVYNDVKDKLIYGESISQTVSYAATATDMGIIAKSSLFSPRMSKYEKEKHWKDVDPKLYTPIDQGMVLLKHGSRNSEARAFYDFILGAKAKKILLDFGYLIP
ncbi:molybdate ABC transporter substrate-binding protein [Sulfurovum riftiae]|uniref:Molybdate ABC transporter substrate-binding protein n=1 Tax=Sulfurovum riftiae TaxID=1630136 RepID=A0A151CF76_9BACT|nr:molybdate ABC transporter substrate-binding protein [Sulfurovum riftiae]KYJ86192.1 molybdate ABC transporter substrate-binding protein [Sulfurovum riftiae]